MAAKTTYPSQAARLAKHKKANPIAEMLLPYFPDIKKKLTMANKKDTPVEFMEKAVNSTIFITIGLLFLTAMFLQSMNISLVYLLLFVVIYPIILFKYFLLYPDVAIIQRRKAIDYEIVFAGRHLVIALKSGMPLFDAMRGVSEGYGEVSKEFNNIVEKVMVGAPISQAIREVAQNNPSKNFVRIIMQIANALSSGANVADSLDAVLNQISKEQVIELKEYGQKLTPMVMFFMIFGIILPSLGVAFLIILMSLISTGKFGFNSYILVFAFAFIAVVQFLFLALVESSRPKYAI
jgi:flagellar protein FlaJ